MVVSPLHIKKQWLVFAAGFVILIAVQLQVLRNLGFNWRLALWDSTITNLALAVICVLLINSLGYYLPKKNEYLIILIWIMALAGLWTFIIKWLLKKFLENETSYLNFLNQSVSIRFWFAALVISCVALVSVLYLRQQENKENEKRKTDTISLSKEAELYKLRQQLQPHFLFNSLNSIYALITTEPEQARKMIHQLSDFLRGTLKNEEHQWVRLADELHYLQLYLDIEKVRFGHRLSIEILCDDVTGKLLLPPMLLQPIVENAIKFGLYDTTGAITIRIETKSNDGYLIINVQNPFDPQTSSSKHGTGFGLSSAQRRLYLLFARNDLLTTSTDENLFTTIVKIPQHDKSDNH
ncbi:MAG: histidine kinase [Bacteroidota bacterium]|nr:histidine kinase [Bacteroidota bacterium]